MTGHWTHRDRDIHRCALPAYERGVAKGDRWVCDECGIEHIVVGIDSDQRDGSAWLKWQEYESWKSGPFAPGTK